MNSPVNQQCIRIDGNHRKVFLSQQSAWKASLTSQVVGTEADGWSLSAVTNGPEKMGYVTSTTWKVLWNVDWPLTKKEVVMHDFWLPWQFLLQCALQLNLFPFIPWYSSKRTLTLTIIPNQEIDAQAATDQSFHKIRFVTRNAILKSVGASHTERCNEWIMQLHAFCDK